MRVFVFIITNLGFESLFKVVEGFFFRLFNLCLR